MKSDDKRVERATDEIANRMRRLLADIRPKIAAKHQLTGALLDGALVMGLASVAGDYEKMANAVIEKIGNRANQQ